MKSFAQRIDDTNTPKERYDIEREFKEYLKEKKEVERFDEDLSDPVALNFSKNYTFDNKNDEINAFIELCKFYKGFLQGLVEENPNLLDKTEVTLKLSGYDYEHDCVKDNLQINLCDLVSAIVTKEINKQQDLELYIKDKERQSRFDNLEKGFLAIQKEINKNPSDEKIINELCKKCYELYKDYDRFDCYENKYTIKNTQAFQAFKTTFDFLKKYDERYMDFDKFQKQVLNLAHKIKDYENKKSVLLPDAKARIPQEILKDIEKFNKAFNKRAYKNINAYLSYEIKAFQTIIEKPIKTISLFMQNHQSQTHTNTR